MSPLLRIGPFSIIFAARRLHFRVKTRRGQFGAFLREWGRNPPFILSVTLILGLFFEQEGHKNLVSRGALIPPPSRGNVEDTLGSERRTGRAIGVIDSRVTPSRAASTFVSSWSVGRVRW